MTQSSTTKAPRGLRIGASETKAQLANANPALNADILLSLYDAALSSSREDCKLTVAQAASAGIAQMTLADHYIPAVAKVLGDHWCSDVLGFASVTIGVARLQALLRELGPEWSADSTAPANAPGVLLITPRNAAHTLGAAVIAGQLRRNGYSVRMAFDADRQSVASLMDRIAFDAIFISAARSESLDKLRRLIEFVRTLTFHRLPIAIGGSVLETSADVAALTGADIMTSNIDEAITFCGLKEQPSQNTART